MAVNQATVEMIQFHYQVLRYQPDKVGEEFMNLGVVVFAPDTRELRFKYLDSIKRLSAFFPAGNNVYIKGLVRSLADSLSEAERQRGQVLEPVAHNELASLTLSLLPGTDSALYFSEARSGLDTDLDNALDALFDRMVTRYEHAQEQSVTDKDVWGKVYRKYFREFGIEDKLTKKKVKTPKESFTFDRTWQNSHLNCLETVNFDLKYDSSIKDKVHRWFGKLTLLGQASEDLHIYLLSQLPKDPEQRKFVQDILAEAQRENMKVDVVDETKAALRVKELADEINHHG